jgi:hypothetical protein
MTKIIHRNSKKLLLLTTILFILFASIIFIPKKENPDLELDPNYTIKTVSISKNNLDEVSDILLSNQTYLSNNFKNYNYDDQPWGTLTSTYNLYLNCLNDVGYATELYKETKNIEYLNIAKEIIESWFKYKETPESQKDRYLWYDHSIASRTQILIDFLLQQSNETANIYDSEFISKIEQLLEEQGLWLYDDKNYSQGNHGLMMDRALLELGIYKNNLDYVEKSTKRINNRIQKDFTNEGVHLENSTNYHILVMNYYTVIKDFLKHYGLEDYLSEETLQTIDKMPEYLVYITMPNKVVPPIGDSEKLVLGNDYDNENLKYLLTDGQTGTEPKSGLKFYEKAGIAIYRETWSKENISDSIWWTLKSGSNNGGHKQDDDLSFMIYAFGNEIFSDAGKYNYENEDIFRQYVLSPQGHNSISIKDKRYFADKNLEKIGYLKLVEETDCCIWLKAENNAYSNTEISRDFIFIKPNIFLILDKGSSNNKETFLQTFLLSPEMNLKNYSDDSFFAESKDGKTKVYLQQHLKTDSAKVYRSDDKTGKGYVSESFETKTPIDYIEFEKTSNDIFFITTIELNPDSYNYSVDKINLENNLLKVYINNDLFVFDLENLKIK